MHILRCYYDKVDCHTKVLRIDHHYNKLDVLPSVKHIDSSVVIISLE